MVLELIEVIVRDLMSKSKKQQTSKRKYFDRTRGRVEWDMEKCDFCQDCQRVCPANAVEVKPDENTIIYKPYQCIYCHRCVESCMPNAIKALNEPAEPTDEKKDTIYKKKQN